MAVLVLFGCFALNPCLCLAAQESGQTVGANLEVRPVFSIGFLNGSIDFGSIPTGSVSSPRSLTMVVKTNHGMEWHIGLWADAMMNEDETASISLDRLKYTFARNLPGEETPAVGTWAPLSTAQAGIYASNTEEFLSPETVVELDFQLGPIDAWQRAGRYSTTIHMLLYDIP